MGLRLYSEFISHNGKEFKIEIFDSEWSLNASSFVTASDGFTLNYSGETDDIVSPIVGSNATIRAYNQTDVFDNFIEDLKEYQEERFTLKISKKADQATLKAVSDYFNRVEADGGTYEAGECLKFAIEALGGVTDTAQAYYILNLFKFRVEQDGGTVEGDDCVVEDLQGLGIQDSYFTYWTGTIMQDLITVEDTHKPYVFSITAVDGIGLLAQKDYTWATYDTIESFIGRAVTAIGNTDLYSDTDTAYATTLNTWDTNHSYSTDTDVASLIRFHAPVLKTRETDGTIVYPKYLDVLREICIAFGARFYQREGAFIFEQYLERDQTERRVFSYGKDGTLLLNATVSDDLRLDQTSEGARLAGNQFNYLPALKKVSVTHNKELRESLLGRFVNFYTTTPKLSLGVLSDDNNAYLQLQGRLNYRLTHPTTGTDTGYYRARFRIELKIEDQANPGTFYYLKRDWNPSGGQLYGATSWSTSVSYYYLDASLAKNTANGLTVSQLFNVVTPPLPVEGEAEIDMGQNGLYNQNNASVSVPSGYFAGWSVEDVLVSYKSDEANSVSTRYQSSNSSTKVNSNLTLDLGEVRLADAFGGPGSYLVYNGSSWVPSSDWRRGNSGSYDNLLSVLTKEVLSLHTKPIERYNGTIVGSQPFGIRYQFDGGYWLPISGSYNANFDEWSAEWFKIEKDETNIAIGSPVDEGSLGDVALRVSSSQGTDEFINAVNIVATTSEVTGASSAGSVQLTGGSGDQGLMQWDGDEETVTLEMNGTQHFIGQDMVYNVKNTSGAAIDKGTAVMATGTLGSSGRITIARMDADGDIPARFYLGVTAENIENGADGKVVEFGKIKQLDTSAYSDGTVLWLDPAVAGGFTATEPSAPNLKIATAIVINAHATTGVIFVRANQGQALADLHDVNITNPADGDILRYNGDFGYWYNTPFPG